MKDFDRFLKCFEIFVKVLTVLKVREVLRGLEMFIEVGNVFKCVEKIPKGSKRFIKF